MTRLQSFHVQSVTLITAILQSFHVQGVIIITTILQSLHVQRVTVITTILQSFHVQRNTLITATLRSSCFQPVLLVTTILQGSHAKRVSSITTTPQRNYEIPQIRIVWGPVTKRWRSNLGNLVAIRTHALFFTAWITASKSVTRNVPKKWRIEVSNLLYLFLLLWLTRC